MNATTTNNVTSTASARQIPRRPADRAAHLAIREALLVADERLVRARAIAQAARAITLKQAFWTVP